MLVPLESLNEAVSKMNDFKAERNLYQRLYGAEVARSVRLATSCRIMLHAFDALGRTETHCPIIAAAIAEIRELSRP
jgi:hypothetical protein